MRDVFGTRNKPRRQNAQTLVFFLISWGTIMLLCGLAIDSGLLYLAKARLARAVDGAALAAVGNFNRNSDPATNRDQVALIMRNFAAANFTDLSPISSIVAPHGGSSTSTTLPNGQPGTSYTYIFNDGTWDGKNWKRYVEVVLNAGSGGAITSATCNARCPVQTYFIGYATYAIGNYQNVKIGGYTGVPGLFDLKVSSSAIATRNPRLIMVVVDRSASMLAANGGGASGLPPAIVQFLDFFDTTSDNIGIVSFGSSARLEMPLTTNFLIAGTNNLIDAYETNKFDPNAGAEPGVDPEDSNAAYATTGIRRLKFGGQTAADEGIRLGLEQLMANAGFNDPDVTKYMVIFTDGQWNATRTLVAAPGYTNEVYAPIVATTNLFVASVGGSNGLTGPWQPTNEALNANIIAVPSMGRMPTSSSLSSLLSAITYTHFAPGQPDYTRLQRDHTNDTWQSTAGTNEPWGLTAATKNGAPMSVTNWTWLATNNTGSGGNYYTHDVDVWLQPGSVAYYYTNAAAAATGTYVPYVSDYTKPNKHIYLYLGFGGKVDLVVPGYVVDGIMYDYIDLPFSVPLTPEPILRYRGNNYQEAFMWQDDQTPIDTSDGESGPSGGYVAMSLQRDLMFRNYPNLLTGFYVFRPDEPLSSATEPLDDTTPPTHRPLYGLGPYYPSAGFYWPFDLVGVDYDPTYGLIDPNSEPDPNYNEGFFGGSRHIAYSINMLSTNAAPEWSGELFYKSTSGGGLSSASGISATSVSTLMKSADWQNGMPTWMTALYTSGFTDVMTNEPTHNTNIVGSPSVWRPVAFNGSMDPTVSPGFVTPDTSIGSRTGGYVMDGNGNIYKNTMAWSGRPTHYFDFSQSKWIPIADNHTPNIQMLPLGNWKAGEYAWHARALGVTIYTVGYGGKVQAPQCTLLAQLANATNVIAPNGSGGASTNANPFNPNQPIGQQFYATTPQDISNDFYQVGQAINAALTQ